MEKEFERITLTFGSREAYEQFMQALIEKGRDEGRTLAMAEKKPSMAELFGDEKPEKTYTKSEALEYAKTQGWANEKDVKRELLNDKEISGFIGEGFLASFRGGNKHLYTKTQAIASNEILIGGLERLEKDEELKNEICEKGCPATTTVIEDVFETAKTILKSRQAEKDTEQKETKKEG